MRARPRRRFGMLDAMALVAATALGLATVTRGWPHLGATAGLNGSRIAWAAAVRNIVVGPAAVLPACWMLALIPLRLRRPRPRWALAMRQPGMVACCAVAITLALGAACEIAQPHQSFLTYHTSEYQFRTHIVGFWRTSQAFLPFSVAGAWVALAASGRWRAGRDWIDRTGRALGAWWIALLALDPMMMRWVFTLADRIA